MHTDPESITPVLDLSAQEYERFLDEEVEARMGMTASQFTERYLRGELDDSDPDVPLVVGMLWIGQNGHHAA